MANKIKYGIRNVYYAKATIASNGSATYGTPTALPGAKNLSLASQGESSPFYADDIIYWTGVSNTGYEGDLELAMIPDSFYKDIFGEALDANNIQYEDADANSAPFALTFEFQGNENSTRYVMYNCTAKRPDVAGQTKEASIEPATEKISITCSSIYVAAIDKNVVKAKCPSTQTTQYSTWNSSIYQPAST